MVLDYIASHEGIRINRLRFQATCAEIQLSGKQVLLLKPQTFMNNSGEAVRAASDYYRIPSERVLVICDDISLPCAKLRIRAKGSSGGHKGLKSIITYLGNENFPRIKVGISDRINPEMLLSDWVLGNLTEQERSALQNRYPDISDAIQKIIEGNIEQAMCRYN